ncbi:MAG: hypothetical protein VXY53_03445 [Candidatus Thermoplasmatota archaeon]|nr:hypothetical protein [Candidatus Thermoplasmatota archaeon]
MSDNQYMPDEKSFTRLLTIPRINPICVDFNLPPSKSHMIRLLALSSISAGETKLIAQGKLGRDIESMISAMASLGVGIERYEKQGSYITSVTGVGEQGFTNLVSTVYCGNSGTALRIVMGLIASIDRPITVSGDDSLSARDNDFMINSLSQADVTVEKIQTGNLPISICGPWFRGDTESKTATIDCSKSSQALTSWMIASALFPCDVILNLNGKTVSNKHYLLTKKMCNDSGAKIEINEENILLNRWNIKLLPEYIIPGDSSIVSFAILLVKLHNCEVRVFNWPDNQDALGNELLKKEASSLGVEWVDNRITNQNKSSYQVYDLTDCNDLITPLSAILAISGGGKISGITHTIYKESNRIEKTIQLLADFGLKIDYENDSLVIEGGQNPRKPISAVNCHNDHRLFMTAALLMSKFGGELIGQGLHEVADVDFMTRLGL